MKRIVAAAFIRGNTVYIQNSVLWYICIIDNTLPSPVQVTVVGDGKGEGLVVAGDKLYSSEQLVRSGTEAALPLSVKDTCSALSRKVFE